MIRNGTITVEILSAASHADLQAWVRVNEVATLFAADLSLGASRAFHAAYEFGLQMGIAGQLDRGPVLLWSGGSPESRVASFVEGRGTADRLISRACRLASLVVEAAMSQARTSPCALCVVLPRFGLRLSCEDEWFLYFLAVACMQATSGRLVLLLVHSVGDPLSLPRGVQARGGLPTPVAGFSRKQTFKSVPVCFPGIVLTDDAGFSVLSDEDVMPLPGGCGLVNWTCRPANLNVMRTGFRFAEGWRPDDEEVHAYLLSQAPVLKPAEVLLLAQRARHCAGAGGCGVALSFFERAVQEAWRQAMPEYGRLLLELQFWYLSAQSIEAAALCQIDARRTDPKTLADLHFTKGWALSTTGQIQEAERHFALARGLDVRIARHALDYYFLNVYAHHLFRLGEVDEAMTLNASVERALGDVQPNAYLEYTNHLNQARVMEAAGRTEDSVDHCVLAFQTTEGARSASDAVLHNAILARAYEKAEQPDNALRHYWLACLHWLCMTTPESLSVQALHFIFGKRMEASPELPARVSALLGDWLSSAAAAAGLGVATGAPSVRSAVSFVLARHGFALGAIPQRVWLIPGFGSLIACAPGAATPGFIHETMFELAHWVVAVFEHQAGLAEGTCSGCICVDDQWGNEVPMSIEEAVASAVRWSAPELVLAEGGGQPLQQLEDLDWEDLEFALASGVATVHNQDDVVQVEFKRGLPPVELDAVSSALVNQLVAGPMTWMRASAILTSSAGLASDMRQAAICILQALEAQRVLISRAR